MPPSVRLEVPETLHYETRSIRDELDASNFRLSNSKKGINPSLVPQQGQIMTEQWQRLATPTDIDQDQTAASGNPQYEQMRNALLQFEQSSSYNAPARERAFYSALRSVLTEAAAEVEPGNRETRLAAAFKWFTKHRPRASAPDPHLSAALASSLSLQPAASEEGLLDSVRRSASAGRDSLSNTRSFKPFVVPAGTKQDFFSVYSKEASPFSSSAEIRAATARATPPTKAAPFGRPPLTKVGPTMELPVGMQPAIARGSRPMLAPKPPKVSSVPVFVPKGKSRMGEEDLALAPSQPPSGPRAASLAHNSLAVMQQSHEMNAGLTSEDAELVELRGRFARMDRNHQRFEEDIAAKMRAWALQRARLEEEITRRQESSRFSAPLAAPRPETIACPGDPSIAGRNGANNMMDDPMAHTYLSPYSQYAKMAAQVNTSNLITEAKAAYMEDAVADVEELGERLGELGLHISPEVLTHALVPVKDKTFLECIAKLPKPGDHLPGKAVTSAKGKRKGSSKGKRKTSGRKRAVSR